MTQPILRETRLPRIVDLVFAPEPPGGRRRLAICVAAAALLYAGGFTLMNRRAGSLDARGAAIAARTRQARALDRVVDLTLPERSRPSPSATPPAAHAASRQTAPRMARVARAPHAPATPSLPYGAPARAGQPAAVSPEPIDFTDTAFVVGTSASYPGGATTGAGTADQPSRENRSPTVGAPSQLIRRDRSRPISLDQSAWSCAWPAEADAAEVNEQTVVLHASVASDGRPDRVDLLTDPGLGFGAAARLCALRTHFTPALDPAGRPVSAESPPIRVHFFR